MEIKQLTDVLQRRGLEYPSLSALQANQDSYRVLLIQPKAEISVSPDAIRNNDRDQARSLFSSAMALSRDKRVELLVTPEYSMPWEVLEAELSVNGGPSSGHLWVLGCESIAVADAMALEERFAPLAAVIHEEINDAALQPGTARYFNPLVYLFRTHTSGAEKVEKLVMLVQFKTEPSGDPDNIEAKGMAKGKHIYMFEGVRQEIRLVTFICSDVLALQMDDINRCYEETLVLHIQLNEKPRTQPYSAYRRNLYRAKCDRTELICLNWAEGVTYFAENNDPVKKKNISASSWHSRSLELDISDERVEKNQRAGLYYTRHEKEKVHMLHFSYEPAAFLLESTKVKHSGVAAGQSYRRGPELVEVFGWSEGDQSWLAKDPVLADGFYEYCKEYESIKKPLRDIYEVSALAAERVVAISSGEFGPGKNWYMADHVPTARIIDDEVVNRITVTHDPESATKRDSHMSLVKALKDVSGEIPFKAPLEDLKEGFNFEWKIASSNTNVAAMSQPHRPATVVFAGVGQSPSRLSNLYAKTGQLARQGDVADRFCVVYQEGTKVKIYEPAVREPISSTKPIGSNDFTEPE